MSPTQFTEVKCPRCGWVHMAVPLERARQFCEPQDLARYFRCFNCSAPSSSFVPARPEDAPYGCTLQPVVLGEPPKAFDSF